MPQFAQIKQHRRNIVLTSLLFALSITQPAFADWLKPSVQWPGYDYPYWGQQDPYQRYRAPRQTPRPSRPAKRAATKRRSSVTTATATVVTPDIKVQQPIESADPLRQLRRERTAPAAATAMVPVKNSSSDRTSIVWDESDSLDKIASACGSTAGAILRENALRRSELREGQVLEVMRPAEGDSTLRAFSADEQRSREIWRGVRGEKRIALTFDAGGETDGSEELIANLVSAKAAASFFVTGEFVSKNPKLAKQIADAGFPIHNHSWSHPEFTTIPDDKIEEELQRTDWAVRDIGGKSTKPYWRPPFGDRDPRVLSAAAQAGYQSIYWTLDSLDSVGDEKSAEFVVNRILNPPKSGGDPEGFLDGAIILMHVGMPETARAVPTLIRELRARGFTLVTVDEIVNPAAKPRQAQ